MNHRIIAGGLFALSLVGILLGYLLLRHPDYLMLCPTNLEHNCLDQFWRYGIAKPLFWDTRILPFLFFTLIFVRREIFFSWTKFFSFVSIIPLILIIIAEPISGGWAFSPYPDRGEMTGIATKFLTIVSFIFIAFKYVQLKNKDSKKEK
jgi:hypothetical protein